MTPDEARLELIRVKHAINDPKIGLFGTKKLYRQMGELLKIIETGKDKESGDAHSNNP